MEPSDMWIIESVRGVDLLTGRYDYVEINGELHQIDEAKGMFDGRVRLAVCTARHDDTFDTLIDAEDTIYRAWRMRH
jgi:hypothetical protein